MQYRRAQVTPYARRGVHTSETETETVTGTGAKTTWTYEAVILPLETQKHYGRHSTREELEHGTKPGPCQTSASCFPSSHLTLCLTQLSLHFSTAHPSSPQTSSHTPHAFPSPLPIPIPITTSAASITAETAYYPLLPTQ